MCLPTYWDCVWASIGNTQQWWRPDHCAQSYAHNINFDNQQFANNINNNKYLQCGHENETGEVNRWTKSILCVIIDRSHCFSQKVYWQRILLADLIV